MTNKQLENLKQRILELDNACGEESDYSKRFPIVERLTNAVVRYRKEAGLPSTRSLDFLDAQQRGRIAGREVT